MKHNGIGSGAHSFYMLRENRKPPLREDFVDTASKKRRNSFVLRAIIRIFVPK